MHNLIDINFIFPTILNYNVKAVCYMYIEDRTLITKAGLWPAYTLKFLCLFTNSLTSKHEIKSTKIKPRRRIIINEKRKSKCSVVL